MERKPLDEKTTELMDSLFNGWLAQNQMLSKGGTIYQADQHGHIKKDPQGKMMVVGPGVLKQKMMSQDGGFESYVRKQNKLIKIKIEWHPFPKQ